MEHKPAAYGGTAGVPHFDRLALSTNGSGEFSISLSGTPVAYWVLLRDVASTLSLVPEALSLVGSLLTVRVRFGAQTPALPHTHGAGSLAGPSHTHGPGTLAENGHSHGAGSYLGPSHTHTLDLVNGNVADAIVGHTGNNGAFSNRGAGVISGLTGINAAGGAAVVGTSGNATVSMATGATAAGGTGAVTGSTSSGGPGATDHDLAVSRSIEVLVIWF